MKKFLTKEFLILLVVSFLIFEGIEHLLHEVFDIHLEHYLALGGVGTVIILGFKFHILCCAIPTLVASVLAHMRLKKKEKLKCCDEHHCGE